MARAASAGSRYRLSASFRQSWPVSAGENHLAEACGSRSKRHFFLLGPSPYPWPFISCQEARLWQFLPRGEDPGPTSRAGSESEVLREGVRLTGDPVEWIDVVPIIHSARNHAAISF